MRLSSSIHRRRAPLYNNERTHPMLDLKDFIHLPQLATLFDELAADAPGFVVVAGLEPRPLASQLLGGAFRVTPPSGRSMVFGIVARRLLAAHPGQQAMVVAETRDVVRFPKRRGRVEYALVRPPFTFASLIEEAIQRGQAKILFFFQAEDGIRDPLVTGVQTCALPI